MTILNEKLRNPQFKRFYDADPSVPKDLLLTFSDWSPLILSKDVDPLATETDLNEDFLECDQDQNSLLDFEEYRLSLTLAKLRVIDRLNQKLKDPEFRRFYEADQNRPKDELLTYDEWQLLAKSLESEVTDP